MWSIWFTRLKSMALWRLFVMLSLCPEQMIRAPNSYHSQRTYSKSRWFWRLPTSFPWRMDTENSWTIYHSTEIMTEWCWHSRVSSRNYWNLTLVRAMVIVTKPPMITLVAKNTETDHNQNHNKLNNHKHNDHNHNNRNQKQIRMIWVWVSCNSI